MDFSPVYRCLHIYSVLVSKCPPHEDAAHTGLSLTEGGRQLLLLLPAVLWEEGGCRKSDWVAGPEKMW